MSSSCREISAGLGAGGWGGVCCTSRGAILIVVVLYKFRFLCRGAVLGISDGWGGSSVVVVGGSLVLGWNGGLGAMGFCCNRGFRSSVYG